MFIEHAAIEGTQNILRMSEKSTHRISPTNVTESGSPTRGWDELDSSISAQIETALFYSKTAASKGRRMGSISDSCELVLVVVPIIAAIIIYAANDKKVTDIVLGIATLAETSVASLLKFAKLRTKSEKAFIVVRYLEEMIHTLQLRRDLRNVRADVVYESAARQLIDLYNLCDGFLSDYEIKHLRGRVITPRGGGGGGINRQRSIVMLDNKEAKETKETHPHKKTGASRPPPVAIPTTPATPAATVTAPTAAAIPLSPIVENAIPMSTAMDTSSAMPASSLNALIEFEMNRT